MSLLVLHQHTTSTSISPNLTEDWLYCLIQAIQPHQAKRTLSSAKQKEKLCSSHCSVFTNGLSFAILNNPKILNINTRFTNTEHDWIFFFLCNENRSYFRFQVIQPFRLDFNLRDTKQQQHSLYECLQIKQNQTLWGESSCDSFVVSDTSKLYGRCLFLLSGRCSLFRTTCQSTNEHW